MTAACAGERADRCLLGGRNVHQELIRIHRKQSTVVVGSLFHWYGDLASLTVLLAVFVFAGSFVGHSTDSTHNSGNKNCKMRVC